MIVVSFKTKKDANEILRKAMEYFVDVVGLKVTDHGSCCVYFADENRLGYVNMTLSEEKGNFEVTVESKEFEYQAKEFVRNFK